MAKEIPIKCPKCGVRDVIFITDEDLETIRKCGIARVGFIHRDHILLIDIDQNCFVRGGYIMPFMSMESGVKLFFQDYKVLTNAIVGINLEFIVLDLSKRVIDARPCPSCITNLYNILLKISEFIRIYGGGPRGVPKFVGIKGQKYSVFNRDHIFIFSPDKPSEPKHKSKWLYVLCNTVYIRKIPDDAELSNIVSYIEENISHEPSDADCVKLRNYVL